MPKLADPTLFPPAAPAADDAVMARTGAGGDKAFLLGNLAGLATLTPAADQSAYYNGTTWATYSLTAAGRALSAVAGTANTFPYFSAANVVTLGAVGATGLASLAAATQAAGRTALGLGDAALQNIGTSGANVPLMSAANTWGAQQTFSLGAQLGNDQMLNLGAGGAGMRGSGAGVVVFFGGGAGTIFRPGGNAVTTGQLTMSTTETTISVTLAPATDNAMDVGIPARRIRTYYGVNSAINTSDARLKTEPRQLRDAEFRAASAIARLPAVWRWLNRVHGDETCEPEGREARKHFGPTVQAAIAVMQAHELDPFAYSFICYDQWEAEPEQWHEWPATDAVLDDDGNVLEPAVEAGRELVQAAREAGDRYSFRKEELLCFLVAAMARQHDELEERVTALEAKLAA